VTFSEAGGAVVGVASSSPLEMPPVIEDAYLCMFCVSRLVDTLNMSTCFPATVNPTLMTWPTSTKDIDILLPLLCCNHFGCE